MFGIVRQRRSTRRIALAAASLVLATGVQVARPQLADAAITVSGFGNYCSVTNSDSGAWGFVSYPDGQDPCKVATSAGGMTIRKAGLYSASATNNVVVRCNQDQSWVGYYRGSGNVPLGAAFNAAKNAGKKWCTFTVAPAAMPVFNAPFALDTTYKNYSGFDFAKPPYNTLDVTQYGQTGSTKATIVDWKARDMSGKGYLDNHDGHDYVMARGTPIKAAAEGVVVMARDWQGPVCSGQDSTIQKEVAIRHTVYGKNGYNEQFLTYYAHLKSYSVKVGQTVTAGQQIGLSGNTGCSNPPHLHFGVVRLTNTAKWRSTTVTFYTGANHSNGTPWAISPYGFSPPKGFDPWAWRAFPSGALSINLWKSGQAPSTGDW